MREYQSAAVVSPSNTVDLTVPTLALTVTVAGVVTVDMVGTGTNVAIPVAAGVIHRLRVTRVYVTGTTATGIVALW